MRPRRVRRSSFSTAFQFTHPGRGATQHQHQPDSSQLGFQFTHPGRGATVWISTAPNDQAVSIHAPREGCDPAMMLMMAVLLSFNSRTPGGVRLLPLTLHSLSCKSFNSRTPGGVRPQPLNTAAFVRMFQFTHPGRGATDSNVQHHPTSNVSIHAPREGCDMRLILLLLRLLLFQFTHPGRGATYLQNQLISSQVQFQFTHPGRGATVWCKVAYYGADKQA